MPRRRSSRILPSGLRAFLPTLPKRPKAAKRGGKRATGVGALPLPALPSLPLPGRSRPKPAPPRRAPRPAAEGTWVSGAHLGPAGGRSYDVYVPAGLRRRTAAPLVLLLHGCGQTPAEFAGATRFTATADRNGFLLVLPHQQSRHHPQRCWRWYETAHQQRDAGEPGILAAVVAQVTAEQARWRVDPRRVYVAGLSAGGAMALTLAAGYPDVFAAAGVHSAPAYRSSAGPGQALAAMAGRTTVPPPEPGAPAIAPTIVVQGDADTVVRAVNGDRVADQWLAYRAAATGVDAVGRSRADSGRTTDGRSYDVLRWYTVRGRKVLEYWTVHGLGHAWSGGREKGSFSDPAGPRSTTLMWAFFRLHALERTVRSPVRAAGA
jgi:poly(hydroxyalkanoate) depolymerase family esterase